MQQYQLAVANRDDRKATEAANIANQNIGQMNQYARDLWTTQVQEVQRFNPRIENGVLITKNKNPDGTTTENHTPIDPAKQTAVLMQKANVAMAQANASNEYDWQVFRFNQGIAATALPYAFADAMGSGNIQGRDGLLSVGLAEAANAVTQTGKWEDLYIRYLPGGLQAANDTKREAYARAGLPVDPDTGDLMPGTKVTREDQEAINSYISTQIMQDFVNSGKSWVLVGGNVADKKTGKRQYNPPSDVSSLSITQQREESRKVRRGVDSKGRPTFSESY
jgi:hypothetical protein